MNTWRTEDDVLKDLIIGSGGRMNIDDVRMVRGSRPPPPPIINEDLDEEFNLRFGGYGDHITNCNNQSGPDLNGITEMLRMVPTYDKPQDTYPSPRAKASPRAKSSPKKSIHHEEQTIVISKLNPNVKAFVPKTVNIEDNVPEKVLTDSNQIAHQSDQQHDKKNSGIIKSDDNGAKNSHCSEVDKESVAITPRIGGGPCSSVDFPRSKENPITSVESNEDLEKQKAVAQLKSKINAASKEGTNKRKMDKNVAMAAFLRLNSGPPRASSNSSSNSTPKRLSPQPKTESPNPPLVLYTPDYFAGPRSTPKEVNVDDSEHAIPEPTPLLETIKTPSPQEANNPDIKESIQKVNNWLNSPEKKAKAKAPVPYIGPVTFKKKESISPRSPCSDVSKRAEPVHSIPAFVPSRYAAELAKDLEARVKAKEESERKEQPPQDIWTKLETDLKARDEALRNRSREQLDDASSSPSAKNSRSSSRHEL